MLSLSLQIVAVKMLPGQVTSGQREPNETFLDGTESCKYFRLPTTIPKVAYLGSGWSKLLWGKSLKLWLCPESDYKSFLVGLVGVVDGVWFSKEFWLLLRSLFKNVNHWQKVKLVPDRAQGIPIAVGISFQHSASNGSRISCTKKTRRERERERITKSDRIYCVALCLVIGLFKHLSTKRTLQGHEPQSEENLIQFLGNLRQYFTISISV